jgi:selenide,water dikinase
MLPLECHGATDVTGFGIMGHGTNLVKNQKASVNFEIHTLPMIKNMKKVDERTGIFNVMNGYCAETSGNSNTYTYNIKPNRFIF